MANWRDTKRKMRRGVHGIMGVPAYFIARSGAEPIAITVRGPYTKSQQQPVGHLAGQEGYAERIDTLPHLRFDRLELATKGITLEVKKSIISIEDGEAYRIESIDSIDDEWLPAEVSRLSDQDADGLPVPGDA